MQSSCPGCGRYYTHQLNDPWLIVCTECRHQITDLNIRNKDDFDMPDDLSTLQVGTDGVYKLQSFTITGRIRFQMRTDFRNLWCARHGEKTIWIGQSLESIGFFTPPFMAHADRFENLKAGASIEFTDTISLKCEMMEPCVAMHYEGEISRFPLPDTKVTLVQASNASGNTALIFINQLGKLHYLWGELMLAGSFKFNNLKSWTEW
jgi:hypothetical protein